MAGPSCGGGSSNSKETPPPPLTLFVIGATCVGKTKMGVDLAKALGGEVVSADSMQVYRGFSIGSAKATEEEMQGVPHHMLDVCGATEEFSVAEYRTAAAKAIEEVHARCKPAIVVGGTMLYVQSLLFDDALIEDAPARRMAGTAAADSSSPPMSPSSSYTRLKEVDPKTAEKLHPNDTRRIRRALDVFKSTGKPASEHLEQQSGGLKYPRVLLFWLDARDEVLDQRIDRRAEVMVEGGVIGEILGLRQEIQSMGNYSTGLTQGIGFKEFREVADDASVKASVDVPPERLASCLELLQKNTRRYARQQRKWIRGRFVRKALPVFRLDTSDVGRWRELVLDPALAVVERLAAAESQEQFEANVWDAHPLAAKPEPNSAPPGKEWKKEFCERCEVWLNGPTEFAQHLQSKQHRKHKKQRKEDSRAEENNAAKSAVVDDKADE